jgi:hypothetical protein
MRRHPGPWLLGAAGLVLATLSAVWGAGLFDRPAAPPPEALASTSVSITVGNDGAGSWTVMEPGAAAGVLTGLVFMAVAVVLVMRRRRGPVRAAGSAG